MNVALLILFCLFSCTGQAKTITFSKSLIPHVENQYELIPRNDLTIPDLPEQKLTTSSERHSLISYNTIYIIINLTAFCYASYKIYVRSLEIGKPVPETFVHKIVGYVRPIQMLTNRGGFFIDSGGIILETILYKTLAQLILLCASSDILELFESAISRSKRIARALIM